MSKEKIAISIDRESIGEIDRLIDARVFANRSQAIQQAVSEKIGKYKRERLALACSKVDPLEEQQMAEEGMGMELENWPEY
jgi:metal-responsive CopG/Arc/MetJ family transcriptional regulator